MNSPVPIPNTPTSLLPAASQRASQQPEKDDGGPFKTDMVHRMESLTKGERIIPPCDRCRRLHMDCLKNLTACMGCTKKHAKCSWKEVRENELRSGFVYPPSTTSNGQSESSDHESGDRASTASPLPRHTITPLYTASPGNHPTPQPQSQPQSQPQTLHQPPESHGQHSSHYEQHQPNHTRPPPPPLPLSLPSSHTSPPERDQERQRNVEAQLQEAAQSSLAHANARLGAPEGKGAEFQNQPMVA